ncbi:MAG: nucleotidyl transferase AbiEii/AbiGii toxin family protein [Acidobacteriota bacterium]
MRSHCIRPGRASTIGTRIWPLTSDCWRCFDVSGQAPLVDVLHAAARVLAQAKTPWYVFGAQAATVWGVPRMSADVDLTVRVALDRVSELAEAMTAAGFRLRVGDADEFVGRTRVLPFVHVPTGLPVDVVLSGPGIEDEFHRRAVFVDLAGVQIPFISPEDLIVTKVLAGRPKDIEDVGGVLRIRGGELDLAYVRSTLELLSLALSQSDLVPALDAALAAARGGSKQP